ncbi:sensor histidine kinase [Ureibacillus acetophenoni]|uniref:histidine kinase n=1 Tax=Ureibacillus acetophenoni TaxID=614649 RepID=A0A285UMN6_9BACL|nr:HAMP domain-containing sensor histidine kinase [Ureibacillus acetophenoni]SOC43109.1 signal transduction histidine kinase [Ureibacillus acetophenoni]
MNKLNPLFPKEEGIFPYIYLANMCIPLFFMLSEPTETLYPGLLLLFIFVIVYRQIFWSSRFIILFIVIELVITLILSYFYNPLYLYIVFVFSFLMVRLQWKWLYWLCGSYAVLSLILIYKTIFPDNLVLIVSFLPPVFGGAILPFVMKASLRYKELNEDLRRVAEELKVKSEEKERLEESKKRMLADLSHDLKTPMTTIQGYSKALYDGFVQDEEQKQRYLKYIYDKSIRVTDLIDELFVFSKLDNPDSQINKQEKDLCEFLRQVVVEYYEQFDEKEMELSIEIPSERVVFSFDQKLLYRAISNILENTIKYNPEQTTVYISLKVSKNHLTIEIGDNGSGIHEDIADTLFDPFVRGDKSRMNDGGTGLGLAITKKIIEKHNGLVYVDTKPLRGSTNFIIELPLT